jgi:cysteine desulfurase
VPRAYLDHASSSPLRPVAYEAMLPYLRDHPGDPGRVHSEGRTARVALENARDQVAALFGARSREVVFTASGTESVNTAVWGATRRFAEQHGGPGHVVTTAVEHSAVLDACRRATPNVSIVGVDRAGRVDPTDVLAALRPETSLVSVQLANHETGTVQDGLGDLADALQDHGALLHVDACAAGGHLPVDFVRSGADLCSLTAHKLGGPKGAAALLVRRGLRIPPLIVGGMQERARRGGIEDVPAAVGFGAAAMFLATGDALVAEAERARAFTERVTTTALDVQGVERFGDAERCLPHLVCLGVAGVEAEPILLSLDQRGIAVHSGSSCSSEALEPSPVLLAMGVDADRSLRVSVGWSTVDADVDAFCAAFPEIVAALRSLRGGC